MKISVRFVCWEPCYRIIPSRFPPIQLFERIADPADLEDVIAVESMTNDRLRDEVGDISLVPPQDRISGPGSSYILAAFTHPNPSGSRFSDGSFGVYYAAQDLRTAVAETRYHRAAFMAATAEGPMELDMRVVLADLQGLLHDLRGAAAHFAEIYRRDDYGASQVFARRVRGEGANGIAYDSVRNAGGFCVALFRPTLLSHARQERHLTYVWNGREIEAVYEKMSLSV